MLFLINFLINQAHPQRPNMVTTGLLFVVVVVWTVDRSQEKSWPLTQKIFVLKARDFMEKTVRRLSGLICGRVVVFESKMSEIFPTYL